MPSESSLGSSMRVKLHVNSSRSSLMCHVFIYWVMEMKDRIRQIMDDVHMSQQDFAARLGISAASLSSIFTGRTRPTNNHVQAVHKAFPEININWLLFGEGESHIDSLPKENRLNDKGETPTQLSSPTPELRFDFNVPTTEEPIVNSNSDNVRKGKIEQSESVNFISTKIRKIREIRVFYDDGTYETFSPSNK